MDKILNAIAIPADVSVVRLPNARDEVDSSSLVFFDGKTIFYDVFIDKSESKLVAIGPPALNLASYLEGMKLVVNGKPVSYRFKEYPDCKVSFLEAGLKSSAACEVSFHFKDFSQSIHLQSNHLPSGLKVLAAISKNNEIAWVSDWVDYYKSNYNIDEVFIYDNGSDNVGELEDELKGRAHVIRWSFPYGPPKKRFNKFAQPGALNHCLRKYAKDGVLFNFDIDELLIADRAEIEKEVNSNGTLYVSSYNVPFVNPGKKSYSFYDFVHREKSLKKSARKFICKGDSVDIISQHNTWTYTGRSFWKRLRRNKPSAMQSRNAYFLHFLGITTNWQPDLNKLKEVSTEGLVHDDSHCDLKPHGTNRIARKAYSGEQGGSGP
ncbi:hypothetical protein [Litchfieldella rifensis]|uniref:Glycosyltransferase family 92 protein n=1 Tax=Litchfieldella rifensis TaxID=762643 RepID=A0ABV7LU66_9GAMM